MTAAGGFIRKDVSMNFIVNYYQGNFKLLLIASNEDERNFLESHIGEIIELKTTQQPHVTAEVCDCGEPSPESGKCVFCGVKK